MLHVRLLGGLELELDGAPLAVPAGRCGALLGWLALHPGMHPRGRVAAALWPEVLDESARRSLRTAVLDLRKALGPDGARHVVATRNELGLETVEVDVGAFADALADGRLEVALDLSDAALLAGFEHEWVHAAREAHRAAVEGALVRLADAAEDAGDLPAAIARTRRLVALDPLSEAHARGLIRRLAAADDRAAALAAYDHHRERLRVDLHMAPSAATRALVDAVRGGAVARTDALAAAPLPPTLARTVRPHGRQPALDRLELAWRDALGGTVRLALTAGEPGIGKTTLAGELARRVHLQGATVLYGRSDEQTLVGYQPFVEVLEAHLAALGPAAAERWLGVHDGALTRLLPGRGTAGPAGDGRREQYLAFEVVRAVLEDAAGQRPVLLILDDLHWADEDSLALLRHLAHRCLEARLLVVLGARSGELSAAAVETLGDLRRFGPMVEIGLAGLDDDAVAAVVRHRTGQDEPDAARRLRQRTGGNPFFLDAVLRDEQEHPDATGPPPGVLDVLARRLGRLPPKAREVLELAAVIGLEPELAVVARAGDVPLGTAFEALDAALDDGLVVASGAPGRIAFVHALVGEAIVAGLPASHVARLHQRVATALAAGPAPVAGEVARHLRRAAPLVSADELGRWELAAAHEASAGLAHAEAAAYLERALEVLPAAQQGALLLDLGRARDRAGRREEARAAFRAAAAHARAGGDARELAGAALGHGGIGVVIARPDPDTRALLEEALAAVGDRDRALAARLRARLATELYYDDAARTLELAEEAIDDARVSGDPGSLALALNARRVALWHPGRVDQRLATDQEMAEAAEAAGDRELALQARNWRVVDLWEQGRIDAVRAEVDAYAERADRIGLPHFRWYVPLWRSGLALIAGRWAEADAHRAEALALGVQADDANARPLVEIQRAMQLTVGYRFAEVDRDWIARQAEGSAVPDAWRVWLAQIAGVLGDHDAAREAVTELTRSEVRVDANWHALAELAEGAAEVGDAAAAAVLHERLSPFAGLYPVVARGICSENLVDYFLGRLDATLGRLDAAEQRLRHAVAANDANGAGAFAAAAQLRLGEVLLRQGDVDRAQPVLIEAQVRAERLAMPELARLAGDGLTRR